MKEMSLQDYADQTAMFFTRGREVITTLTDLIQMANAICINDDNNDDTKDEVLAKLLHGMKVASETLSELSDEMGGVDFEEREWLSVEAESLN